MIRDDESRFLLYMEPSEEKSDPVVDAYTKLLEMALKEAKSGTANYSSPDVPERFTENSAWRGIHRCRCGQTGGNQDFLLKNGMITNELAPHYLMYHRDEISENDWVKIKELMEFYYT